MSSHHSVEKIGGTSMVATGTPFDNVLIAEHKKADLYDRVDIQFVMDVAHFDAAVQALRRALVEADEGETERWRAA